MKRLIAAFALGLAACGQASPNLVVDDAQYRPPLGETGIGVAYFSVMSSVEDRIVGVSSPEADRIEVHASVMKGDQVSMQRLDEVELPAGKPVVFGPNGMHLMVFAPRRWQKAPHFRFKSNYSQDAVKPFCSILR